jgi:hypothetical protein
MSSETIPEWAMEEGLRLANDSELSLVTYESSGSEIEEATKSDAEAIARALLAAEQRGLEKSAAKADEVAKNPPGEWFVRVGEDGAYSCGAIDCAAAIRSLGDKT